MGRGQKKKKIVKSVKIIIFVVILAAAAAGFFYVQTALAREKVNINTAGLEELDALPGIGPSKARAIIDYRETNGLFRTIEEITDVSGIGPATFEDIKNSIMVDGSPSGEFDAGQENKPLIREETKRPARNSVSAGDVVINEFVSDPADGEEEWIELYNTANRAIDLSGWTIEEGSGAKTYLDGEIGSSGFFVAEKINGYLNNKGDIIILRDSSGNLIDSVAYGGWEDGDMGDNALAAADPYATARKIDGWNSGSGADDFALTASPTKGGSNVITKGEEAGESETNIGNIVISEILPDPFGIDADGEFIELYNGGQEQVDLLGWRLASGNNAEFEFTEKRIIAPNGYLAVYRSESGLVLDNRGGGVKLFKPGSARAFRTVKFKKAKEGWSYNIKETKSPIGDLVSREYIWSDKPTPGGENKLPEINNPPLAIFYYPNKTLAGVPVVFDASDTVDEDGDDLSFAWDFGDGFKNSLQNPEHTFMKDGVFTVRLVVSDGKNEVVKEKIIQVGDAVGGRDEALPRLYASKIVINEFLPDPRGSDSKDEWIELYNQGDGRVNLYDWKLDDEEGGSRPYVIADLSEFKSNSVDNIIGPGEYLVINREESGLALNNAGDSVRLFNALGELVDEAEYSAAVEGASYARGRNGKWFWTDVLTPGKENVISAAANARSALGNSESRIKVLGASKSFTEPIFADINEIGEFGPGDLVIVKGVVAALPGIFSPRYFYIVSEDGAAGLQIYSHKKDFPELKVGDYIEAAGELSSVNGERRLKIKSGEDIEIIDHRAPPIAEAIAVDEINEDYIGRLVEITGEITARKGSAIYLDDDTGEAAVYVKKYTGINARDFKEGEIVTIAGIVGGAKSGARIMPRGVDDILREHEFPPRLPGNNNNVQVLGELPPNDEWTLEARDKKAELFKYLLIIAGGIIIVLGGLLAKAIKVIDE